MRKISNLLKSPYISKVKIKNFRNFLDVEVNLNHKQVIIGENNIGKTNFLKAIQLILDPTLSEEDRFLEESDFNDSIENPMENQISIEISIEIQGYELNTSLLSTFASATVSDSPPTIRFTYVFKPIDGDRYGYHIYQGVDEENSFNHNHRKMLNIKVINGLRDANSDLKNIRKSPLNKLIKQYEIEKSELEQIASKMKSESDAILNLEEIIDLKERVNQSLSSIVGSNNPYSATNLETIDINPNKILNTLRLMVGDDKQRPTSETSLGVTNILYIALILLSIEDRTIPKLLKKEDYIQLLKEAPQNLLEKNYLEVQQDYFKLKQDIQDSNELYTFFSEYFPSIDGHTILAIEEPEAHLHPILQRCIFKDVMKKPTSIILTTHSSDITSVSPIESMVHLRIQGKSTEVNSTAELKLNDKELMDLQRYIDVKRGEIFFGKGVVLVEGIAEEFLVPAFAEKLGKNLDYFGIICCNINSTNFKPYISLLRGLKIPYVILTDGDYFYIKEESDERVYHTSYQKSHSKWGFLGWELAYKTLNELGIFTNDFISYSLKDYNEEGFYFSIYTLEVDLMAKSSDLQGKEAIKNTFSELTVGQDRQKQNFENELNTRDFYACLRKIENSENKVGKGRFAQRLSSYVGDLTVPEYITKAIDNIILQVTKEE
ncbi:ATP-dependent nuclease [Lysinibacillus sphaericus]|uniref:ATP-dependent nuclease n=1 Tax=Lysinibacillus sphaericus TaxID=1421 RepID=UPI00320B3403